MSKFLFTNNASSLLATTISDTDVTLQVSVGDGALFPAPSAGDRAAIALVNADGDLEIVYCTSRTGDLLTITRAQEGTAAEEWVGGQTRVELRLTKGTQDAMLQRDGDALTGDLDAAGHAITDARLTGATVLVGGQTVGTAIRGAEDDASNELAVPPDGGPATMGGSPLLTQALLMPSMPTGAVIMWFGSLGSVPSGWQLCNGTNGTPDLRDRFIIGAGGAVALGVTGGSGTTGEAAGNTGSTALTQAQLPPHRHSLWGDTDSVTTATTGLGAGNAETVAGRTANVTQSFVTNAGEDGSPLVSETGGGEGHTHTLAAHTHTNTPPYVGLYFIMKL